MDRESGYLGSSPTSGSNLLCDFDEIILTSLNLSIFIWRLTRLVQVVSKELLALISYHLKQVTRTFSVLWLRIDCFVILIYILSIPSFRHLISNPKEIGISILLTLTNLTNANAVPKM